MEARQPGRPRVVMVATSSGASTYELSFVGYIHKRQKLRVSLTNPQWQNKGIWLVGVICYQHAPWWILPNFLWSNSKYCKNWNFLWIIQSEIGISGQFIKTIFTIIIIFWDRFEKVPSGAKTVSIMKSIDSPSWTKKSRRTVTFYSLRACELWIKMFGIVKIVFVKLVPEKQKAKQIGTGELTRTFSSIPRNLSATKQFILKYQLVVLHDQSYTESMT